MSNIKDVANLNESNPPDIINTNDSLGDDVEKISNNDAVDDKGDDEVSQNIEQLATDDSAVPLAQDGTESSAQDLQDTLEQSPLNSSVPVEAIAENGKVETEKSDDEPVSREDVDETSKSPTPSPDPEPQASSPSPSTDPSLPSASSESQGAISKTSRGSDTDCSKASVDPAEEAIEESAASSSTPADEQAPTQCEYHVKWIKFKNKEHAIVTQNANGPCPLLAIMNVLLLEGRVKLPPRTMKVTSEQLMDYLGNSILEEPKLPETAIPDYERNREDAIEVFHKLQTGLDVNVMFTGVDKFEYTSECIVFDLLSIPLYHGWLVDPQNEAQKLAIGESSYNQLVENIITQKSSTDQEKVTKALIAEEFLSITASQLTYYGLSEIASTLGEDRLCVFFRNNHFSTLYKHQDELLVLVTDQGFLSEKNVVWETLSNVDGDCHFVNAQFHTFRKPEPAVPPPQEPLPLGSDAQIDHDYMVALSLQEAAGPQDFPPQASPLTDHELAIQLQEEENQRAALAQQQQQQQQQQQPQGHATSTHPGSSAGTPPGGASGGGRERKKSNSDCVIL